MAVCENWVSRTCVGVVRREYVPKIQTIEVADIGMYVSRTIVGDVNIDKIS